MTFSETFDNIMRENMDLSDRETLRTLATVNEADKSKLLVSLTSNLYDKIVEKVDDIDFGTIPKSKGDITKIENFESMMECLNIIRSIIKQYAQDTEPVDAVSTAIDNVRERKDLFTKAYAMNVELPIVFYNTITLSIVSSISFLIATSIEFIKNPGDNSFTVSLDKIAYTKTSSNLLFDDLRKFNMSCVNKDFDKTMEECIHMNRKNAIGTIAVSTIAVVSLSKLIIPIIQELTYFFYNSRQTVSDYFAVQADLLQMNTANIVYKDLEAEKKDEIIKKQSKIANRFKKVANFFDIEYRKAEKASKKEIMDNQKKLKIQDITDTMPDSASLF